MPSRRQFLLGIGATAVAATLPVAAAPIPAFTAGVDSTGEYAGRGIGWIWNDRGIITTFTIGKGQDYETFEDGVKTLESQGLCEDSLSNYSLSNYPSVIYTQEGHIHVQDVPTQIRSIPR